jgi:hypothetical protein
VIFLFFALFHALGADEKWAEGIGTSTTVETEQACTHPVSSSPAARRLAREDDADDRAELSEKIAHAERQRQALQVAAATRRAEPRHQRRQGNATGAGKALVGKGQGRTRSC